MQKCEETQRRFTNLEADGSTVAAVVMCGHPLGRILVLPAFGSQEGIPNKAQLLKQRAGFSIPPMRAHRARLHAHTQCCACPVSYDLAGVGYVFAAGPGLKIVIRIAHHFTLFDQLFQSVGMSLSNHLWGVCARASVWVCACARACACAVCLCVTAIASYLEALVEVILRPIRSRGEVCKLALTLVELELRQRLGALLPLAPHLLTVLAHGP